MNGNISLSPPLTFTPAPTNMSRLLLISLILALFGYWMPWLAFPAGALQMNAYEISEWVTFLPGVFIGELPFNRLTFLLPAACLTLLFALAAARTRNANAKSWVQAVLPQAWLGWGLLALAALCLSAVFPYYPYILTAYQDPEFQTQFIVACLATLAVPLALLLPRDVGLLAQLLLASFGLGVSAWAVWQLWPVASELMQTTWPLGWGWWLTLLGFALALVEGWGSLFRPRSS